VLLRAVRPDDLDALVARLARCADTAVGARLPRGDRDRVAREMVIGDDPDTTG
jgi:hypothetical protein